MKIMEEAKAQFPLTFVQLPMKVSHEGNYINYFMDSYILRPIHRY